MQITLNQDEVEESIRDHVLSQLAVREDQGISIDLRAGPGENGFTATLDVRPRKRTTNGPRSAFTGTRKPVAVKGDAATNEVEVEETQAEKPQEPVATKASKKGIFAATPKGVPESTAETNAAEPGAPDRETPAEDEARSAIEEDGQDGDNAPAEQPENKKSIFAFAPKKSAESRTGL